MRLHLRGPILGIAFLLGPCLVVAVGTLPACTASTDTTEAGADVEIPLGSCDMAGQTCTQCQTCPTVETTCASQIAACEQDPKGTCIGLAMCNDACDVDAGGDSTCKQTCCNNFAMDPDGIKIYVATTQCIYGIGCPETCKLQRALDVCSGF